MGYDLGGTYIAGCFGELVCHCRDFDDLRVSRLRWIERCVLLYAVATPRDHFASLDVAMVGPPWCRLGGDFS